MANNSIPVSSTTTSHPTPWAAALQSMRAPVRAPQDAPFRLRQELTPGFQITVARSIEQRREAGALVGRCYAARGYQAKSSANPDQQLLTLCARVDNDVVGTMSVRLDSPTSGLNADTTFGPELRALRASGNVLCEFTQLAIGEDSPIAKRVLAALFHIAYLLGHRMHGAQLLVIEVNPRHVAYYRRMLGFKVCSEERMNPRVQAPAVLLTLDFTHVELQIARYGGQPALASVARTLYPHVFSPLQERDLLAQLRPAYA